MTELNQSLAEYYAALERLRTGRPLRVSKNTKITNDAVALEAGRGKGSIKKSRPTFGALIQAIGEAAEKQANSSPEKVQKEKLDKIKGNASRYRDDLDSALGSLVSRLYEVHELKAKNRKLEKNLELLMEVIPPQLLAKIRHLL